VGGGGYGAVPNCVELFGAEGEEVAAMDAKGDVRCEGVLVDFCVRETFVFEEGRDCGLDNVDADCGDAIVCKPTEVSRFPWEGEGRLGTMTAEGD
jgi:hypothetical protein